MLASYAGRSWHCGMLICCIRGILTRNLYILSITYHPNIDLILVHGGLYLFLFLHLASGYRTAVLCNKSEAWPWWSRGDPPSWTFEWFWEVPLLYTLSSLIMWFHCVKIVRWWILSISEIHWPNASSISGKTELVWKRQRRSWARAFRRASLSWASEVIRRDRPWDPDHT